MRFIRSSFVILPRRRLFCSVPRLGIERTERLPRRLSLLFLSIRSSASYPRIPCELHAWERAYVTSDLNVYSLSAKSDRFQPQRRVGRSYSRFNSFREGA